MRKLISIAIILLLTALYVAMDAFGLLSSWDRTAKAFRYSMAATPPSGEVVLVEIDGESLRRLDVWPWPREYYAQVLDQLTEMGAAEVAFDIDFSSVSNPAGDLAFAEALERSGGYAYLAAFDQISGITNTIVRSKPIALLSEHAEPVLVNVDLDRDGKAMSFPTVSTHQGEAIESLATKLGYPQFTPPQRMLFDFRIDADAIDRIAFADVLSGQIDPTRVLDKTVIVGASAIELRDFFDVPRFGVIPGPLLQILALETVKTQRVLKDWGTWPTLGFVLVALIISQLVGSRSGFVALGMTALAVLVVLELTAFGALAFFDILITTHIGMLAIPTIIAVELIGEGSVWLAQKRALQARLQYLARHDDVTGVYSRVGFSELLDREVAKRPLTIILVAIKRLDLVRGALGEGVAEETLRHIARKLEGLGDHPIGLVRQDTFGIGIDEHLSDVSLENLAEQIHFLIHEPIRINEHSVLVDPTIGASRSEAGSASAAEALNRALIALGNDQRNPSGHVSLFRPQLAERLAERRQMDIDLRRAIAQQELRVAFQPQVNMFTGRMHGMEALMRWKSEAMGEISPGKFIELAEETGYVVELGEWIMREACQIVSKWNWDGILSVNVSAAQMSLSDVRGMVQRALFQSGYPPERLCLEITESVFVGDISSVIEHLDYFRRQGITIAIDDFGTGFSSLSYLSKLPFDKLKIDQSFVRGIAANKGNHAIVQAIVTMAHKMNKQVIAEGVETDAEENILKAIRCDVGQGYLYGRPVDAQALSKLLMGKSDTA